jgi:hypothetical protein
MIVKAFLEKSSLILLAREDTLPHPRDSAKTARGFRNVSQMYSRKSIAPSS